MAPVFTFHDGELWHRGFWWSRDDMERQATHFERRLAAGADPEFYGEMVRQCRTTLAEYDHHYHEEQAA